MHARWKHQDIRMILQHNFILRPSVGFIGAQNIHRAEVLNRVKVLHDNFCFESFSPPRARGGGDDHRQHFRVSPYRDRKRK